MTIITFIHLAVNVWGFLNNLFGTCTFRYINIFNIVMMTLVLIQKRIMDKPFKDPKVRIKE